MASSDLPMNFFDDGFHFRYLSRQALIQKNLSGVYSDDIFKEQNKVIEEQIADIQITKDDALLAKYNLESIVKFMQDKFSNLGRTYQLSNLSQIRTLLCSIIPSGLVWEYPGYTNTQLSPLYQSIRVSEPSGFGLSAGEGSRTLMPCGHSLLRRARMPFRHTSFYTYYYECGRDRVYEDSFRHTSLQQILPEVALLEKKAK